VSKDAILNKAIAAQRLNKVFTQISNLPYARWGGNRQVLAECNAIIEELTAISATLPPPRPKPRPRTIKPRPKGVASRPRPSGEDLLAAEIIRNADGIESLTTKTSPDVLVEQIARLAESGHVAIKVSGAAYGASAFRRLCKTVGGVPNTMHLEVLKKPGTVWEEKQTKMMPEGIKHKNTSASATAGAHVLDDTSGIASFLCAVTNVVDDVNDIIAVGAFADTLKQRTPKGCWSHEWQEPVARTLAAEELMPGDPRLPDKLQKLGAGGLLILAEFNLQTQRGRDAFSDICFWGDQAQFSIGYTIPAGGSKFDPKTGIRTITKVDLFEYSPVLFGANSYTGLLSTATARDTVDLASKVRQMTEAESMRGFVRSCGIPNTKVNRRKLDALITKAAAMRDDPTIQDLMEFALSGEAWKTKRGQAAARALVDKAVQQQKAPHGTAPTPPYPAGAVAPGTRSNNEEGEPDDSQTYTNNPPGLVVGPHTYRPPAGMNKPITRNSPCLICNQNRTAPIHTDRTAWMTYLATTGQ
jgi:HK97 family phage prohead protease